MANNRYLFKNINNDLQDKMVFLGGPRQVGKTTLAKTIGEGFNKSVYLNWDASADRKTILAEKFSPDADLIIFDELHKYRSWKNYLKGQYDKNKDNYKIILTGSARLDVYRRGGDSLLGRYFYLRLHPFSLSETLNINHSFKIFEKLNFKEDIDSRKKFEQLFEFGGFPEPFFKEDLRFLRRFHNMRVERLVKEDIRDIEALRDISQILILAESLPTRVSSVFSINALREDLNVTHKTISHWVDILERFYYLYRIYPFAISTIKSLRKEPKAYLWDWSQVEDEGARFENIIASHLLKFCHYLYDVEGQKAELRYLRDIDKHEVDFIVTINNKPWFIVEVKLTDQDVSKNLLYFQERIKAPLAFQVVKSTGVDFMQKNIRVMSADKFLSGLV